MDALLDSFDSSRGSQACGSVQDIQAKLHNLLLSKSTDTRAEHASYTFELRHTLILDLNIDAENVSPDAVADSGTQSQQQPITRTVYIHETVQNQPSDDPVLQRAVAKHIVNSISVIDRSSWVVREVTRGAQGWTFAYICKDSLQAWNRANAKNAEKQVIGGYSGPGGLDAVNSSRPAFDCRGTLTIAFSKSARGVIVKYNHTPIHKTVAQLVERLAPDLPPAPVGNGNTGSQRTSKVKRPPPTEGDGSRKKRARKGKAPEAQMGGPSLGDVQGGQNNAGSQSVGTNGVQIATALNVPPDEAERRRQTAINLLNGKGVDPATLSKEQMSIFENQAPDLQMASLDMLAKYGAERLRIVHPDGRETEEQSTNDTTPVPEPAPPSTENATETPSKKKRSHKKKKSDAPAAEIPITDGAVVPVNESGEVGTTSSTLKPTKKTRGGCATCKNRKVKCTKEHPSCSACTEAGVECIYLPPKPRRKRSEIPAEVVDNNGENNEDSDVPGDNDQIQVHETTQAPMQIQVAAPDQEAAPMSAAQVPMQHTTAPPIPPIPDPDNEEFIPDPNILSGPVDHQPITTHSLPQPLTMHYYHDGSAGLTFPQNQPLPSGNTTMPTLTFPESQTRGTHSDPSANLRYPPTSNQTERTSTPTFQQPAPTPNQKGRSGSTSGRRSLPVGQAKQTPVPTPSIPQRTSNWTPSPRAGHVTTISPAPAQREVSKRSRSRKSEAEANQANDGMKQAAALSQAALQAQRHQSPATRSPYQAAARPKSRQAQRSQTNTPVTSTSRPPPQAPQAVNSSYNTNPSTSIPNYDPYARYDTSTNGQYDNVNNDQGSSRIAYEPGSYHPSTTSMTTASYPSVPAADFSRGTGASNPLSQALNPSTGYNSTNNPTATQWSTPQTRSSQHTQSHANNAFPVTSSTSPTTHSYGTRSANARASHQNASYTQSQPQSQSYGSYAQQPNTNQQTQQNWYGYPHSNDNTSASQNNYTNNRNTYTSTTNTNQTAYSGHRTNLPSYSGHTYGSGTEDQALFDLMRSNPTH